MAIGRYLSTDTADRIGGFGDAIGGMRGDMLDYEREKRLREALEARLKKEAEATELAHEKGIRDEIVKVGEMDPAMREIYVAGLSPELRGGMGYRPEVPALDMEIQPPTTPDAYVPPGMEPPASTPHQFETPGVAAVDPFEGYEPAGKFTFMGGRYPTEEARNEQVRAYNEAQRNDRDKERTQRVATDSAFEDVMVQSGAVELSRRPGQPNRLKIPVADYAEIYEDVRNARISLSDVPARVDRIMAANATADTTERGASPISGLEGEQPEEDGPGILGRIGGWIGDRFGEVDRIRRGEPAEPESVPPPMLPSGERALGRPGETVQAPLPGRDSIRARSGAGVWESGEYGAEMGPELEGLSPETVPDSLEGPSMGDLGPEDVDERATELAEQHPAADLMREEELYEIIAMAEEVGWSEADLIAEVVSAMGVTEDEARRIIAQARRR